MIYRAGGTAAVLSLAVSGAAYAAVQAGSDVIQPLGANRAALAAIGTSGTDSDSGSSAKATQDPMTVSGQSTSVTTLTQDEVQPHQVVTRETKELPAGETKVQTAGVDGVARVTYQVTWADDTEISREAVSRVVLTPAVDQVVLVGTGTATEVALAQAGDGKTPESAQAVAKVLMGSYGWGEGEVSCLVSLWNRESGWNYQAENASSGAYGIPQALPGSKMVSAGSDWATNPVTQITWGLGYIAGRYGSPCGAWAHSEATGWY